MCGWHTLHFISVTTSVLPMYEPSFFFLPCVISNFFIRSTRSCLSVRPPTQSGTCVWAAATFVLACTRKQTPPLSAARRRRYRTASCFMSHTRYAASSCSVVFVLWFVLLCLAVAPVRLSHDISVLLNPLSNCRRGTHAKRSRCLMGPLPLSNWPQCRQFNDEARLMSFHRHLKDVVEDQLTLASIHYLRSHYQVLCCSRLVACGALA